MVGKEPKTKFMRVRCSCKNEQIIFSKPSTLVECTVCKTVLAKPTGGKAKVLGQVLEVVN